MRSLLSQIPTATIALSTTCRQDLWLVISDAIDITTLGQLHSFPHELVRKLSSKLCDQTYSGRLIQAHQRLYKGVLAAMNVVFQCLLGPAPVATDDFLSHHAVSIHITIRLEQPDVSTGHHPP